MACQYLETCYPFCNMQTIWTALLSIYGSICVVEINCMHVCQYKGKQTGLSSNGNKVTFVYVRITQYSYITT